jgi:hypothetical protein
MFDRQHAWSFPAQECVAARLLPLCGLGWLGACFSDGAFWNSGARVEENAAAVAELGVRGRNGSGRQPSAAGHMATMRRTGLWRRAQVFLVNVFLRRQLQCRQPLARMQEGESVTASRTHIRRNDFRVQSSGRITLLVSLPILARFFSTSRRR